MTTPSRRSFLKLSGFGFLAACSRGVDTRAIPLLVPAEERVPGRAVWYATACPGCAAGCGVLARSRDGRPVKLEGSPEHPLSRGGLCAAGQASVLSLFDAHRLRGPRIHGADAPWRRVDGELAERIRAVRASGTAVRFLTGTVHGPTALAAIRRFGSTFTDFRHVQYDVPSQSALLDVHEEMLGTRALPRPRFDQADVIVGIDADFLGTWISPVEFTRDYRAGRSLAEDGRHSWHVQFESRVSLTGANADRRHARTPSGLRAVVAQLATAVAKRTGATLPFRVEPEPAVDAVAERLAGAPRGATLVVCGVDDLDTQRLVAWINARLGNYGATLSTGRPSRQRQGKDTDLASLRREVAAGAVGLLLVAGANPAYDHPGAWDWDRVGTIVSLAGHGDETAAQAHFVCPDHHPLESWGDEEPVDGLLTVRQPAVAPLFDTRALVESLTAWSGGGGASAYDLVRATWRETVAPRADDVGFETFWAKSVHDGCAELPAAPVRVRAPAGARLRAPRGEGKGGSGGLELVLYEKAGVLDGRHAHNPWLQELPDPVTKIVWDNYACLSPTEAARLGAEEGDLVDVGGLVLPAHVQPGQAEGVVAVALGYGRRGTDRFAHAGPEWLEGVPTVGPGELVGVNAAVLRGRARVPVARAEGRRTLACTQPWGTLDMPPELGGGTRPMVRATTLEKHRRPAASREGAAHHGGDAELWPEDHRFEGHHWAMVADLSACTGCSACVVGCQAENNVPVVGKDEVARARDMHWIRIDRYGRGDGDAFEAVHQPMMCQHCDHAPCETVCPVLATVQGSEGLNQQIYNRCVGTRYCANNCPYKVRRFNWFDYRHDDALANNALNPDVVVRSRGVMEKCSFCIQRISEAKAEAKREGRPLRDGDVQPACVQSCPADALAFGDRNDPDSAVARAWGDRRRYRVLEELNTKPAVGYLARVRNRDE